MNRIVQGVELLQNDQKMKIFVKTQEYLAVLGLNPNESNRFKWKIAAGFLFFASAIFSLGMLIFSDENITVVGSMEVFNIFLSMIEMGISWLVIVLQQMKIFGVFERMENCVNKSNPQKTLNFKEKNCLK